MDFLAIMLFIQQVFHLQFLSFFIFFIYETNYFRSNLSLMWHIEVVLVKKNVTLFRSLRNMKKQLSLMSLFLFVFTFGAIWLKMLPKVRNSEKIYKWGMAKYTRGVYRKEGSTFCTHCFRHFDKKPIPPRMSHLQ